MHFLDNAEKLKSVDNGVSIISFFTENIGGGNVKPFFTTKPSPVHDSNRLPEILLSLSQSEKEKMQRDSQEFSKFLDKVIVERRSYFYPEFNSSAFGTRYKYNNTVGQRIKQFVVEAGKLADELYERQSTQRRSAQYFVNTKAFDLLAREVQFDNNNNGNNISNIEINGYASFGNDAPFVHPWEIRLKEADNDREKRQIVSELDAIFRSKYVFNNHSMRETDAEISVGLCLIDAKSRQRVSEVKETRNTIVPSFEILNLKNNNKSIYFDVDKNLHYFDFSADDDVVPESEISEGVTRTPVSLDDLTFRRAVKKEHLRKNFRFDWNGDGYVQNTVIGWVSWGGHCNDKAILEAHGVVIPQDHAGVHEYNSFTRNTVVYTPNLLNEMLMSLSEMGTFMKRPRINSRIVSNLSTINKAAGSRDDDHPDFVNLVTAGVRIPYNTWPNEFTITEITTAATEGKLLFREYIVAEDGKSAKKNPRYIGTTDGDRVEINLSGGVTIKANAKIQLFSDTTGYPSMISKEIVLNFTNNNNGTLEPVLVDSVMYDAEKREIYEIYIVGGNKWIAQLIRMERRNNERDQVHYKRVPVGQPIIKSFDPLEITASRETSLENPSQYFEFIKDALLTGRNFTTETSDGAGVWNGCTFVLKERVVWRDDATKWMKVGLSVKARYGSGDGAYLVKLDDEGKPSFFVPLKMAFDFAWGSQIAFAPEMNGQVNATAFDRGVIMVGDGGGNGKVHSEAVSNMLEILHCAFHNRTHVIYNEGKRYYFDSVAQWEEERKKLAGGD